MKLKSFPLLGTIFTFAGGLVLYTLTLAPGLLWGGGDFATFQTMAFLGNVRDIRSSSGIFYHPLWVILAHPFTKLPFRDVAWRANFAAAVFGALALSFVFLSAYLLTRSVPASLLATGSLAVSHTFWTYAVMPKVYSLNAVLLAACLYGLLLWKERGRDLYLYFTAFLYGLSFLNHLVMATAAPGFVAYIVLVSRKRPHPIRTLLLGAFFFILGLTPYLLLLSQLDGGTSGVGGKILALAGGLGYLVIHPLALLRGLGWGFVLWFYQFPVTTFIGGLGLYLLLRQDRQVALLVALAMLGVEAFMLAATDPKAGGVYVWNLHYYLQAYVVFALPIAFGLHHLWQRWLAGNRLRQFALSCLVLLLPVMLYALAPSVARAIWSNVPGFRPLPGRDNFVYVLSPWKSNETGARAFGEAILTTLPPDSVIFADYSIWAVLDYLQVVEHARPDVELICLPGKSAQVPLLLQYRGRDNLFLADLYRYYDVEGIRQWFDILPYGPVYRLVPKD